MGFEQFFADVISKIIALENPVLSQPDMEGEMVLPLAVAYIPSFTIYHVLPDLPGEVILIAVVHMDNILLVGKKETIKKFKSELKKQAVKDLGLRTIEEAPRSMV